MHMASSAPRNFQRSRNFEEAKILMMMSEAARLRRKRLMVVHMCLLPRITPRTRRLPATPTRNMAM